MTLSSWTSDDADRRRRVLWSIPTVLAVLGTVRDDRGPHLMNLSWLTPVANEPSRLVASIELDSLSVRNLRGTPAWTLSLLSVDDRALGRAFVKPTLEVSRDDGGEKVQGNEIDRSGDGAPYLRTAAAVVAGHEATSLATIGDHELWLLTVHEVCAQPQLFEGPASAHEIKILGVHDTRMNYGR